MPRTNSTSSPAPGTPGEQQSISDLLQQLTEQTTRLARKEVELAKAEMAIKGKRLGIGAGAFSAAGLIAMLALGAITAAAILALATGMEAWLAALIVAVVYLLIAGVLSLIGRSKVKAATPPLPEQATASVKEDVQETKEKVKEGRA
jgi:membrane protein